jgi:hypothetical protein
MFPEWRNPDFPPYFSFLFISHLHSGAQDEQKRGQRETQHRAGAGELVLLEVRAVGGKHRHTILKLTYSISG